VEGVIKEAEVKSCTIQTYEVGIHKLYTTVQAGDLPFSMDDASRPESDFQRVRLNVLTKCDGRS
jgi:aspartyl-tRNA synthetase